MKRPTWFKRKRYGWGWYPSSWQGWAILGIYTGALIKLFASIDTRSHSASDTLTNFFLPMLGITLVLLIVTFATGEKPRWQWGEGQEDNDGK